MPSGVYDRSYISFKLKKKVKPKLDLDEEVVPGLRRRHVREFVRGLVAIRNKWIADQRGLKVRAAWERKTPEQKAEYSERMKRWRAERDAEKR